MIGGDTSGIDQAIADLENGFRARSATTSTAKPGACG